MFGLAAVLLIAALVFVLLPRPGDGPASPTAGGASSATTVPPVRLADVALSRLPVGPGPCGTSTPVQVNDAGQAKVRLDVGGEALLSMSGKRFGDLDGDGNDEMAVRVACSYEGGNLVFGIAFVVFASAGQDVRRIGLVDVQEDQDVQRRGRVEDIVFNPGEVVTDERWFAPEDANCCPSTYMTTTWKLENGLLVSQPRR